MRMLLAALLAPFLATAALAEPGGGAAPTAPGAPTPACSVPPEHPVPVDPGDTYLQPSDEDEEGRPIFVHVTEHDMPWRVAIGTPRRPPRYGGTKKAREVAIQAMKDWETAIQAELPWFRLEFVEEDPDAPVQIEWKRRMTGDAAGRGGQRWWRDGGCLRVGGSMEIATRTGPEIYEQLTIDEVEMLVAHEFGHVLGLGHCLECDSAMNYQWHQRDRIYVTELDVRTFLALVGIPNGAVGVLPDGTGGAAPAGN